LAFWQLPKYSSRSDDCTQGFVTGRKWLGAAVPSFFRKPPVDRWRFGKGQLCGTYPQRQPPARSGPRKNPPKRVRFVMRWPFVFQDAQTLPERMPRAMLRQGWELRVSSVPTASLWRCIPITSQSSNEKPFLVIRNILIIALRTSSSSSTALTNNTALF